MCVTHHAHVDVVAAVHLYSDLMQYCVMLCGVMQYGVMSHNMKRCSVV